ncbi:MAG: hypothetical protein K8I27_15115 [Planctomycetes bacterium]|nr:hypothetical protein [Planctomycetota bacterium]
MKRPALTSATRGRARLAILATLSLLFLGACSGGGGGGAGVAFNAPPTGGGTPGNSAPVITSSAPTGGTVGVLYSYQAAATDGDADPLTWALTSSPSGMSVSAGGLVTWTPSAPGTFNVTLQVTDGIDNAQQSWSITVTASGGGGLPSSVSMTDLGAVPNGMMALSDMVEFGGKLFIAASQNPLGSPFGAGVYRYDSVTNQITAAHYDSGSQGFLRLKVFDNKLYAPDGDPNGLTPGHVYIWSTGTGTPLQTTVTNAVHNFDVVKYNNELYVSGSNGSSQSTLHKFDGTGTWVQTSAASYTRLKYMGVLDNEIWASKTAASNSADFVKIGTGMTQSGFAFSQGGGNLISANEMIDGKLYMSVWGSGIGVNNLIVNSGGSTTAIAGITGLMWDVIKHTDGNYYAVSWDGTNDYVFGSTDGLNFTQLYGAPGTRFEQPASNQDGRPSIASYNGQLYVGSSTNGHLYRLD